jgi:hypothetical protein
MKSFLSGRAEVAPTAAPPTIEPEMPAGLALLAKTGLPPSAPQAGGSSVHCLREGAVIKKIIVTCECGKTVEIDCAYDNGTA